VVLWLCQQAEGRSLNELAVNKTAWTRIALPLTPHRPWEIDFSLKQYRNGNGKVMVFGWDLAEWLERCASIPKITESNASGGSELTFRSDLLLTVIGGSTWALIEFACLLCYPGNTLLSAPRAARKGWVCAIQIPKFIMFYILCGGINLAFSLKQYRNGK
jgi:hypothetical protein